MWLKYISYKIINGINLKVRKEIISWEGFFLCFFGRFILWLLKIEYIFICEFIILFWEGIMLVVYSNVLWDDWSRK